MKKTREKKKKEKKNEKKKNEKKDAKHPSVELKRQYVGTPDGTDIPCLMARPCHATISKRGRKESKETAGSKLAQVPCA